MAAYDLAIIGSGGGAFAAAIHATGMGKRVVMIERGTIGGTCVNTGCIPSKALLAATEARQVAADNRFPGVATTAGAVDMAAFIGGKRDLVESMRTERYIDLIAEYGWGLHRGTATFTGTHQEPTLRVVAADGAEDTIEAEHYLVASGSTPFAPPIEGLEKVGYLTSTSAMELDEVPESLLVLGGGYVGLEQAQLFARLGSAVTVLARSGLASAEEPEVSTAISGVFTDEGITVATDAVVEAVRRDDDTGEIIATARFAGEHRELRSTHLLVATGRRPVTDDLGLDKVGVALGPRDQVMVDAHLRSSNQRIWAAGDVTGHPQFVYVAGAHGSVMVDNAFAGAARQLDYSHLPRVTFTTPTIAAVGMTERRAIEAGIRCDCRVLPLEYVPRAVVNRDTRGFIKVVADLDTGRIVGITAVSQAGGELAAAGVYMLEAQMTVSQVANLWCPYLTMAEGIKIACQSFTTDVSKLSCCAS